MSYSSCSNSAIFKPTEYLEGAIGSVIQPTLNTASTASGAFIDLWTPFILPQGVWLITGCVRCDSADPIESILYQIQQDAINVNRYSLANGDDTAMWISFQSVLVADGVKNVNCLLNAITGGANWNVEAGANSVVDITRIA